MLKRKELVIYLTIIFTILIGVFIFVPAVAVQKQDGEQANLSSRAEGSKSAEVSSEDGATDIQDIMKALE